MTNSSEMTSRLLLETLISQSTPLSVLRRRACSTMPPGLESQTTVWTNAAGAPLRSSDLPTRP